MSYTKKIAYNTLIQVGGKIVSTILGLITIGLLLRYLGKTGYGEYTTILAFVGFFCTLTDLGLYIIHLKEISTAKDPSKITSNIFTLRLVSALLIISIAPLAGLVFPYPLIIKQGFFLIAFSFFFLSLNQVLMGVFQKAYKIYKPVLAETVSRILYLAGVYLIIHYNLSLLYIIALLSFASFITFVLNFLQASRIIKIRLRFDWQYWKKILILAFPIALSIAFNLIYFKVDTILLSLMKTQDDVGVYGAAYKILEVLITFPAMFSSLTMPVIALYAVKNRYKFKRAMQKGFDFLSMLAIPLAFGVFFLGVRFLVFLGKNQFQQSGYVLQLLVIAASFIFLGQMFSNAVVALGEQKKMMWGYLSVALLAIILDLALIPSWSYYGAAFATIITEFAIMLITIILVYKASGFFPRLKNLIKYLFCSSVMALFLYFFNFLNLWILILCGTVIYFVVLYILGGIDKGVVKEVLKA